MSDAKTIRELNDKILKQNKKFTDYLFNFREYVSQHSELKPLFKKYWDWYAKGTWSNLINSWNYEMSNIPKGKLDSKEPWKVEWTNNDILYGSPKSLMGTLAVWNARLGDAQKQAVQLLNLSKDTPLIVGVDMVEDTELDEFRQLCAVSILVDEDGKNPALCVSANFRYPGSSEITKFRRIVKLGPLVEMLAASIRDYHDKLHAQTEVSGFFHHHRKKKAKKPAVRDHRSVKGPVSRSSLFNLASNPPPSQDGDSYLDDEYQQESEYPGDDSGYLDAPEYLQNPSGDPMQAAYDYNYGINQPGTGYAGEQTLNDLRGGNPTSPYGPTLNDMRNQSLPPGTNPLMVQGWYNSIVKTARHLAETKAVKTLYSDLKKAASNRQLQAIALSAVVGPAAPAVLSAAYQARDAIVAARDGDEEALAKLQALKEAADNGNQAAAQTLQTAKNMNDMIKQKENAQSQVSGWLYNRPYRTNADVLVDAASGKFPTVGMMLREGWQDGLDFAKNMERKPLSSFLG